jgi:hypothetical protein
MLTISDMQGLWHRSLLVRADAARDTSTWVAWLQGPTLFADLRMPAGRPSFAGVHGVRDLTGSQVAWLAQQEGFAGRLELDGEFFAWRRLIDFQPPALVPDSGRLRREGEIVVEEGRYSPYIEHWHREDASHGPIGAARLRDAEAGRDGFIVRAGTYFMYVRAGDSASLAAGASLADCVAGAASLAMAQQLVDCEISFGNVTSAGWVISRSSLPYREGAHLDPRPVAGTHRCRTADGGAGEGVTCRTWEILELEGDAAALDASAARDALAAASG